MKYEIWTRKGLTSKLKALHREIDDNNYYIEESQRENEETQEKIEAVTKALELIGGAWSPPKKATKTFIKKKVAKKPKHVKKVAKKVAKKPIPNTSTLDFALRMDAKGVLKIRDIISAFEDTCPNDFALSLEELFYAVNAARTSKIVRNHVATKLHRLLRSKHPELASLIHRGNGRGSRYRLDRTAADNFKKISRAYV